MTSPIFQPEDLISSYSVREAIEDGSLFLLPEATAKEAGIKVPVVVTKAVHEECIALTKAAEKMGCDVEGRTWDVLYMFSREYLRTRLSVSEGANVTFQLYVVNKRIKATLTTLKAVIGADDNGKPIITIMFPQES